MTFNIGTPHAKGAGYLLNNQSLGVAKRLERDIRTCMHCQCVIEMQAWKEDGGWCGRCSAPICGPCADRMLTHGCEPFVAKLEKEFNMGEQLARFRKLAGLDAPPPDYQPRIVVGVRR